MSKLKDGDVLRSITVNASVNIAAELALKASVDLTSLYVTQEVNKLQPASADFKVVLVKGVEAISVDEYLGNVAPKIIARHLANNYTELYDTVKAVQAELESWKVEIVYNDTLLA